MTHQTFTKYVLCLVLANLVQMKKALIDALNLGEIRFKNIDAKKSKSKSTTEFQLIVYKSTINIMTG